MNQQHFFSMRKSKTFVSARFMLNFIPWPWLLLFTNKLSPIERCVCLLSLFSFSSSLLIDSLNRTDANLPKNKFTFSPFKMKYIQNKAISIVTNVKNWINLKPVREETVQYSAFNRLAKSIASKCSSFWFKSPLLLKFKKFKSFKWDKNSKNKRLQSSHFLCRRCKYTAVARRTCSLSVHHSTSSRHFEVTLDRLNQTPRWSLWSLCNMQLQCIGIFPDRPCPKSVNWTECWVWWSSPPQSPRLS